MQETVEFLKHLQACIVGIEPMIGLREFDIAEGFDTAGLEGSGQIARMGDRNQPIGFAVQQQQGGSDFFRMGNRRRVPQPLAVAPP